jgi:predicted transcriptional regulator
MDMKERELFERLKRAMEIISKSPKTAAEVSLIFEDFIATLEEIAEDLATTPDEQVSKDLKDIIAQFY